jgi:microcystin-dependent protein
MSTPFLGEIRMFAGNFAPAGWALCDGQTMSIAQNTALFSLLGTFYGGNGFTTFNLPDLRSRVPVHAGILGGASPYALGQSGGVESVTVSTAQMPAHDHPFASTGNGVFDSPSGEVLGVPPNGTSLYATGASGGTLNPAANRSVGGSQPHENRMPYLATSFIIALSGIFPSRN